jgi:CHRD domain
MKSSITLRCAVGAALLIMVIGSVAAEKDMTVSTKLNPYNETPSTIYSTGSGEFKARISADGMTIDYEETFRDLSSTVTQSHIHFGRPALSGGVVLFLCYNPALITAPVGVPTPPICPTTSPATVTGTLTEANVIAVPAQGIDAGATGFAEMIKAIKSGAAYVNVHSTLHPSGEIRGRLGGRISKGDEEHNHNGDEGHDHDGHEGH